MNMRDRRWQMDTENAAEGEGFLDLLSSSHFRKMMEEMQAKAGDDVLDRKTLKDSGLIIADADLLGKILTIKNLGTAVKQLHKQLLAAWDKLEEQKKKAEEEAKSQRETLDQEIKRLWQIAHNNQKEAAEMVERQRKETDRLQEIMRNHRQEAGEEAKRHWEITRKAQRAIRKTSTKLEAIKRRYRIYRDQLATIRRILANGHTDTEILSKIRGILGFPPVIVIEPTATEPPADATPITAEPGTGASE